jgi:hypothetical protein
LGTGGAESIRKIEQKRFRTLYVREKGRRRQKDEESEEELKKRDKKYKIEKKRKRNEIENIEEM